ncbi:MAG: M23 family metallopeptidase, partial [Oscillospiraceae bacterium]|nr:M23 family metallopeptidase [Oscillospiraceae bacterium]
AENLYVWPVSGAVITPFSRDELVFNKTMGDWRTHPGVDIETGAGAKVSAICAGVVEDIYEDALMGTTVVLSHPGDMRSVYANLTKVPTISKGDTVKAGTTIGAVGGTAAGETSETHHLHLEVFKGDTPVNPLDYLPGQ